MTSFWSLNEAQNYFICTSVKYARSFRKKTRLKKIRFIGSVSSLISVKTSKLLLTTLVFRQEFNKSSDFHFKIYTNSPSWPTWCSNLEIFCCAISLVRVFLLIFRLWNMNIEVCFINKHNLIFALDNWFLFTVRATFSYVWISYVRMLSLLSFISDVMYSSFQGI